MYWPVRSSSEARSARRPLSTSWRAERAVSFLPASTHDLAGVGVDQVDRRLEALHPVGVERNPPAFLVAHEDDAVVEGVEDLLAVEAERVQQRRDRDLPLAVDARVDDVLGVELDVEPGAAIRDDPGREQELAGRVRLALVVVEEDARRAVHLGDDDALGAVDDEGAVVGHERHVAHVDVLLLDVLDRAGAGIRIDVEHDEPQRHLERRGIGHAALAALVDVVFRRLEGVFHELEQGRVREIRDREHGLEDGLQALLAAAALRLLDHQELVVGRLLNLDEVRHLRDFLDLSEKLPNALATDQRIGHSDLAPHPTADRGDCPRGHRLSAHRPADGSVPDPPIITVRAGPYGPPCRPRPWPLNGMTAPGGNTPGTAGFLCPSWPGLARPFTP